MDTTAPTPPTTPTTDDRDDGWVTYYRVRYGRQLLLVQKRDGCTRTVQA